APQQPWSSCPARAPQGWVPGLREVIDWETRHHQGRQHEGPHAHHHREDAYPPEEGGVSRQPCHHRTFLLHLPWAPCIANPCGRLVRALGTSASGNPACGPEALAWCGERVPGAAPQRALRALRALPPLACRLEGLFS